MDRTEILAAILRERVIGIVRLGDATDPSGDIAGLAQLITEVMAATEKR